MNLQMQYQNYNNPPLPNGAMNHQQFGYGGAPNVGQNGAFLGQNGLRDQPSLMNLQMQNMIKTEGMQSQLSNQLAMQQAMHNMNYFGANPALYANQARLNSEGNLTQLGGVGGVQASSNHNLNSTSFLEGSGTSYKQHLKNKQGSNQQLNDSNNSPNSIHQNHQNINISQFKNKRIIVKHANIVKKKRQIKIWTSEEDELLKRLCEQLPGKWNEIAAQIPGRNASQCSQRWRRILPTKVRKPWTQEEDNKVLELSEKYGKNWGMIAQHIEGKTGKQVRERYINKLDPQIKRSPWTEEEDQKILDMFLEQGPKWSAISNELHGRPENTVKNRFYSHISRIYLSDDNSYLANKNNDNMQKMKDACSKNSQVFTQKKTKLNTVNNPDAMQEDDFENEEENDDDDDDEDDDEDDQTPDNHQNQIGGNSKNAAGNLLNSMNAAPQMYPHFNGAVAAASQQMAMAMEASKKKNQQKTAFGNGINANNNHMNNDRKNLKIEEEDQDEELMEGPNNIEEEDESSNKKANSGFDQNHKQNEEGKGTGNNSRQGQTLVLNRLATGGLNQLSANNLESHSGDKSPQLNSKVSNSMLAKRGMMIKNLEIPKGNTNSNTQNGMQGTLQMNPQTHNEGDNGAINGMGMISANNLDLFNNTQTPQPAYYQGINLFTNSSLTPLYNFPLQQMAGQAHINQPSSSTQHESASPMFVLGAGINSPAPNARTQLPLFKPPMSGIGNTTPSAITPLVNNQYLVYAPNSLGMQTPGIFGYNQILTPYYIPKQFPSITKIGGGGGTLNELDKLEQNNENNNFINMMNHTGGNYPAYDQTGIQSLTNFNFAPPTPGITPSSFLGNNNQNNSANSNNTNNNNNNNNNSNTLSKIPSQSSTQQHQQQINPTDLISYPTDNSQNQQGSNNNQNKNGGSNISISSNNNQNNNEQKKDDHSQELSAQTLQKPYSLESLLSQFTSLDPEKQKLFQQMISQQSQPPMPQQPADSHNNETSEKIVKEEHVRKSFTTHQ